jgi:DNA polymerase III epsilon subunit-like protein
MKTITMLDVETTGLDPVSNEIIEIGLVTFEAEATFKVLNTFNTKVKPVHPETGHPRAFEVNGYNSKDWEDAPSIGEVLIMINELEHIKGSTMASYNVSFDYGFIQAAYRDAGVV